MAFGPSGRRLHEPVAEHCAPSRMVERGAELHPGRVVLMRTELDRYMDGHRTMSSEEMLAMAEQKLLEMEMRRRKR